MVPEPVTAPVRAPAGPVGISVDRVGPGGGIASDSAFGVALVSLWQRCAESGDPVGFALPVARSDVAARVAGIVDEVRTGRVIAVAANRSRRLIGVALLRPGRGTGLHTGRVALLLVDPEQRRQGLGSRLIGSLQSRATELGLERWEADVVEGTGAERLARKFGMTEWGRRPRWVRALPGDERDELLFGGELGEVR